MRDITAKSIVGSPAVCSHGINTRMLTETKETVFLGGFWFEFLFEGIEKALREISPENVFRIIFGFESSERFNYVGAQIFVNRLFS